MAWYYAILGPGRALRGLSAGVDLPLGALEDLFTADSEAMLARAQERRSNHIQIRACAAKHSNRTAHSDTIQTATGLARCF
jgi:hypothetical protein